MTWNDSGIVHLNETLSETKDMMNDTDTALSRSSSVISVAFCISVILIWIPGTFINLVSLFLIIKDIKKAVFPAAILLLMLCCCDLAAVVFSCARHILVRYAGSHTYPLCATLAFLYNFFKMSSGTVNCLMTVDRMLAICYPFIYKRFVTVRTWILGCLIAGSLIVLHSLFPLIGLGEVMNQRRSGPYCSSLSYRTDPIKRVFGMIFGVLGVIFVLTVVSGNVVIIKTLISLGRKVNDLSVSTDNSSWTETNSDGEKRASTKTTTPFEIAVAKLMLGLATSYFVLGTPYNVSL